MEDDDFDLPTLPDRLQDDSPVDIRDLRTDSFAVNLKATDLDEVKGDINKKVFAREMASCDLYLHNIHKGFKYATSVHGILSLVTGGLNVHKHRRGLMQLAEAGVPTGGEGDIIEYDNMGNPKKVSRS